MNSKSNKLLLPLLASLTLGLAPYTPEPHIWMDLKWVFTGANGMKAINWFDLIMHGAPWVWLFYSVIQVVIKKKQRTNSKQLNNK